MSDLDNLTFFCDQALNDPSPLVLLLASILPLIDSSLVNVLLPVISRDLKVSQSDVQLGVSAYMLAATAGIVLSTTSLRHFGPRHAWTRSVLVLCPRFRPRRSQRDATTVRDRPRPAGCDM